jgi:glycerate kinase
MLKALVDHFAPGKCFDDIHLKHLRFILACDVDNPLYGDQGAAVVFGPQKGATKKMITLLDRRARTFATMSAQHYGYDDSDRPGAGAAGGLGYAFMQYLGAERRNGIDLLLRILNFDHILHHTDMVITGEGKADSQTLMGKLPVGILHHAQAQHIPVTLISGQVKNTEELLHAGFDHVICINPTDSSLVEAMKPEVAKRRISDALFQFCSSK